MAELRERTDELEQFSYVASHDLREPLRTLVNWPQRLAREYAGKFDAQADDWINRIINGATRMRQLIDDLSQYARVIRRDRAFGPTACAAVARDACDNLQASLEESGAVVELGDLPTVLGNQQQLMLLYQNLIGNAVKFRDPGRPVRIDVGAQREGDSWLCWVRDNGIGIDEKYLRRIFGLGERLHAASKYAGTGFGLAICEKIVTGHRGRIWATSEAGQGSTFFFTLVEPTPD
jgi:light-regulated signal transduction histidine kinase (bacteriophytochrome)